MMAPHGLAHVRTCFERVRMLEAEHDETDVAAKLARDRTWLLLPLAKRETALRRHQAFIEYERIERPTAKDADAAAAGIGVGRRIFYRMLSDWRENGRSVFSLVPYRGLTEPRASKLPDETVKNLRHITETILAERHDATLQTAVRRVVEQWPSDVPLPSSVTIRNYLGRRMAEQPRKAGSISIPVSSSGVKAKLTANAFGEVLVIDHTAPARLLVYGGAIKAPTITLVMDLHSGLPIGASVTMAPPSSQAMLDALADAKARLARRMHGELGRPPAILSAVPATPKMRDELAVLRESGCRIIERRVHGSRIGEMVRQIMGPKLEEIPLLAARADRTAVVDIDLEQEALVSLREARLIVDTALERLLDDRFPADVAARMSAPLLPDDLAGRADLTSLHVEERTVSNTRQVGPDGQSNDDVRERLHGIVLDCVGGDLAGVAVNRPNDRKPYWQISLRPSSAEVGYGVWSTVVAATTELGSTEGLKIVVRLLPADA